MIPPPTIPPAQREAKRTLSRWLLVLPFGLALIIGFLLYRPKRQPPRVCGPEIPSPDSVYATGAVLGKNEVLAGLLRQFCIPEERIKSIYDALRHTDFNFRGMRPGDSVSLYYQGLDFSGLDYHSNPITTYQVRFDSAGNCVAQKLNRPVDTTKCVLIGVIENSLWNSLLNLGGTPELVVEFAEILRYDIDFFTECSNGDTFELLADKLTVDGRFYRYGRVYAVHYRSRTENVYGFYYRDPAGRWDYYNEKGQSLRKTLLRSPLSYAKVSSYFGMRLHPILRVMRPHQGVDYVAPRGTPVSAIADGVVTHAGWWGGYGNLVEIKHSGGLVSRYGHLSGYGPGIKVGRYVHQGATVGYVGATGLATGPHLHFEIRSNGKPVNPLKVIPPRAEPVAKNYFDDFQNVKNSYLALINRAKAPPEPDSISYKPISISK